MDLMNACVWCPHGCVYCSARSHLAKMLELENNSHAAACPEVSHRPLVAHRRPSSGHHRVLTHFKFEEADMEAIYYSTESLLSALPPNYISAFEVFFFFPALPHLCCWCVDRPPLIASLWPWLNGDDVSAKPHGATRCIPNPYAARGTEPQIKRLRCVGGRETLQQQQHWRGLISANAATQTSFVTAVQTISGVNLAGMVQIILGTRVDFMLIFNVAHILYAAQHWVWLQLWDNKGVKHVNRTNDRRGCRSSAGQ